MNKREIIQSRRRQALIFFWALIFAKCFILEYFVQRYAAPVNTVIYVWSLSLFMATVASLLHLALTRKGPGTRQVRTPGERLWLSGLAVVALLATSALAFAWMPIAGLPALISAGLAVCYAGQFYLGREPGAFYSAAGWLAAVVFSLLLAAPAPLLIVGLACLIFTGLPAGLRCFHLRARAH